MPEDIEELLRQANLLRIRRDYSGAAALTEKALALEESVRGRLQLGEIREDFGDFAGALHEYHRALEIAPGNPQVENRIGCLALRQASMGSIAAPSLRRSPLTAALLSAIFPGAGELYNLDFIKGLAIMLAYMIFFSQVFFDLFGAVISMSQSGAVAIGSSFYIFLLLAILLWLYSIYDAYTGADKGPG